ncbi:hypothetical protein BN7_4350 [Wickerhamomyces ciferrii]|uniref:Uncharacterized protein n=1 Tax=Wickerhamomyces ciferrii (strain ATCC 14091 / BCRC 22168 / CBS 111 / JCM 3599 / NBRC 0793 / NRRL Y-1031 F-60-10) TaxID=1206466 RepID=K0KS35_WICCF|nr:uncharacterized protein BN7_4350 [Wickerhamomyces ciferrii]CCH44782.1 hypothetical protein BN7_4350 [Wickerhamomyces ciferrii]
MMTLNAIINTIITAIRSFLHKCIETLHILYTERDIFEALAIWLGIPRGCGLYYIHHSYYNTVFRPLWKLDRLSFPIRYYSSNKLQHIYEYIDNFKISMFKSSLMKTDDEEGFENIEFNIIDESTSIYNENPNNNSILPMEIWEYIAYHGEINYSIMLSINKSFFYTFAPKVYDTLKLTIVLSPLTKMKLTDESFLKNGSDTIRYKYCDSYSIYERDQESKKFDYEFLDTTIEDQDFFKCNGPQKIARPQPPDPRSMFHKKERYNHPFEIRSLKKIQLFLKNVLQNPNSIMKKYIKEILVDICMFHGFDKLMTMEKSSSVEGSSSEHESLEKLIYQEIKQHERTSVLNVDSDQEESEPIDVAPLDENFDRIRWKDPLRDKGPRFYRFSHNVRTKSDIDTIRDDLHHIFPQNVYFKELLSVYLLSSDKAYSHILRRRLSHYMNPINFQKFNPIKNWSRTVVANCIDKLVTREPDTARYFRMIITGQSCVKITNREFKTKLQVYEFLDDLIKTLTIKSNDYILNNIQSSILILGINDGKPQVPKEFTQNASINTDASDLITLLKLNPELILINRFNDNYR